MKYVFIFMLTVTPLFAMTYTYNAELDNHFCTEDGYCHIPDIDHEIEMRYYWEDQAHKLFLENVALRKILSDMGVTPTNADIMQALKGLEIQ